MFAKGVKGTFTKLLTNKNTAKININCVDTNLYPVIYPRSAVQANDHDNKNVAFGSKQCFHFDHGGRQQSLCVAHSRNNTEISLHGSPVQSTVLDHFVDKCNRTGGTGGGAVETQTFYFPLHQGGDLKSDEFMCTDGECVEDSVNVSTILGRNMGGGGDASFRDGPSVTSCLCSTLDQHSSVYDETFWIFMVINGLISVAVLSSQGLVDSFVINQLPANKRHHFGYQRMWGSIGFGATTLAGGYLKG